MLLGIITPLVSLFYQQNVAYADSCPKEINRAELSDDASHNNCLYDNYNKARDAHKKATGEDLSLGDYNNLITSCDSKDGVQGSLGGTSVLYDTTAGNCSNAVRSCFENVVDQNACKNGDVLGYAAGGNDATGNVGGEGTGGFGEAIDFHNENHGGDDFDTNSTSKDKRKSTFTGQQDGTCDGQQDLGAIRKCHEDVDKVFEDCYNRLGGKGTAVSTKDLNSCTAQEIIKTANNEAECTARNGLWGDQSKVKGCKTQYSDFTSKEACESTKPPGKFVLTDQKDVNNPSDDVYTCQAPTPPGGNSCKDGSTPDPTTGKCADGSTPQGQPNSGNGKITSGGRCGYKDKAGQKVLKTNLLSCDKDLNGIQAIGDVLKQIILWLTGLIAILATGGIAFSATMYASARDDAGQTQKAIERIRNIVIGLLSYGFMIAIINWLIPGGVIG